MYSLLFLAATSLFLSLILTPLVRDFFETLGIVDYPDANRKIHSAPIPRVGGIAVAIAYTLSFALLLIVKLKAGLIISNSFPLIWKLFPAAILIFTVGLLDDLVHLKAWQKLVGQLAAAVIAYWGGIRVYGVVGAQFPAFVSLPLTVTWLVGCCNAINLIDGVDGLAAGVSLVATTTMLLGAAIGHNVELALATLPLVGCLLGFLRYNFNPATVFLGDSGSLFIGFLLGCYGVLWSEKSATVLGMTAPLLALAIPLLDTVLSIARRFLRHQPIFTADRGHIHHRLLDRGLTPRRVALLLYGICGIAAIFSLIMANGGMGVPVILIFVFAAWMGIQRLGFIEFDTAGRMLVQGSFRRLISANIALRNFESKLAFAKTPDEIWSLLKASCPEFGFQNVSMHLAGHHYSEQQAQSYTPNEWRVEIPLSNGYIRMARAFCFVGHYNLVAPLVDVLQRTIESNLSSQQVELESPPMHRAAGAGRD